MPQNVFDQFDEETVERNAFDQFDQPEEPVAVAQTTPVAEPEAEPVKTAETTGIVDAAMWASEQIAKTPRKLYSAITGKEYGQDDIVTASLRSLENIPDKVKKIAGGAMSAIADKKIRAEQELNGIRMRAEQGEELGLFDQARLDAEDDRQRRIKDYGFDPTQAPDILSNNLRQKMTDKGREMFKEATEGEARNQPQGLGTIETWGYDVINASVEMIPTIAATMLTRSPVAGATTMSGQVGAITYGEGLEIGLTEEKAADRAIFHAIAEGLPESLVLSKFLKGGSKTFKKVVDMTLGEGATEAITSVLQQTYDLAEVDDMTLADALKNIDWKQVAYEGSIGMGLGTMMGAGGAYAERRKEKAASIEVDQQNTPPGVLFNPTHKTSDGIDVQQATKAGKPVPGVYVDIQGNTVRDPGAVQQKVVDDTYNAEMQAESIKAEIMGDTSTPEARQGIIESVYGPSQVLAPGTASESLAATRQAEIDRTPTEIAQEAPVKPAPTEQPTAPMPVDVQQQATMLEAEARESGITDPTAIRQHVINALYGEKTQAEINQDIIDRAKTGTLEEPTQTAEYAREQMAKRLPENFKDPRLGRDVYRDSLKSLVSDLTAGGGVALVPDTDYVAGEGDKPGETPMKRTPSLNPPWAQEIMASESVSVPDIRKAVDAAMTNEKLGVRQARVVTALLDQVTGERTDPGVIEYVTNARKEAQELRRQAGGADQDIETAGEVYEERDYEPEWDGDTRSFYEIYKQAEDIDAGATEALFDSMYTTDENLPGIATALYAQVINKGEQDATRPGYEKISPETDLKRPEDRAEAEKTEAGAASATEIAQAASSAEGHTASDAQIEANNYKKGHIYDLQGFKLSIENEAGTKRRPEWPALAHHYGDVTGTLGADGDPIDVFIKKSVDIPADNPVYVINQNDQETGNFDEHKVMIGFDSEADAKAGYLESYTEDFEGFGDVVTTNPADLKEWIETGDTKSKYPSVAVKPTNVKRETTTKQLEEQVASKEKQTEKPERRTQTKARELYEQLSKEELIKQIISHELTGIKGRKAFVVDVQDAQVIGSIDADSLKWVNDNLSPDHGDALLQAVADTVDSLTDNAYHISGDEFYILGASQKEIKAILAQADAKLSQAIITATKPDGSVITLNGLNITYGIGATKNEADTKLKSEKTAREKRGERAARGEQPPGATIESAERVEADRAAAELEANKILDSANVVGKDRLEILSKFRADEYSLDDLTAAYPAEAVVTEKAVGEEIEYPIADRGEWYGDADYKARGGRIVNMSPDKYIASVRPLDIDEESRENIDILKEHIQDGKTLDPLAIYEDGSEDGRHRAYAAKELGIKSVPVIVFGEQKKPAAKKPLLRKDDTVKPVSDDSKIDKKPMINLSVDRINKLVEELQSKYKGMQAVKFTVRDTQDAAFGKGSTQRDGRIKGGFYPDTNEIVLIAENIKSTSDALIVIRHEIVGHYGLRKLINKEGEFDELLDRVYAARDGELKTQYDWVAKTYPELIRSGDTRKIADEMLARSAETRTKPGVLTEIYEAIINLLRKYGLLDVKSEKNKEATLKEVDKLIRLSRRALRDKAAEPAVDAKAEPAYSKDYSGIFYSQMQAVLNNKLPEKGTSGQLKQQITNLAKKGEFKQEELEWSGVNEWLDSLGGKKISKQDVIDFLKANQIEVTEVEKGAENLTGYKWQGNDLLNELNEHAGSILDTNTGYVWMDEDGKEVPLKASNMQDAVLEVEDVIGIKTSKTGDDLTKFEQYQLPGGENYRELLLALPEKTVFPEYKIIKNDYGKYDVLVDGVERAINQTEKAANDFIAGEKSRKSISQQFKSGHYDEPNILAHIRYNERTDADGKRVLFIEEVQSDWHQAGRKQGYGSKKTVKPHKYAGQDFEITESDTQWITKDIHGDERVVGKGTVDGENGAREYFARWLSGLEAERVSGINIKAMNKVPDAPFKTTWPLLSMKRMIRHAAENGFDSIAWTTGEQQAERYDLSKQVEELKLFNHGDGNWDISATKTGGGLVDIASSIPESKLEENIGKDLSKKAIETQTERGWHTYSGLDLKVGGEGMKGFYDNILPKTVNKYVKKWGGRVGETEIEQNPSVQVYKGKIYEKSDVEKLLKASEGYGNTRISPITGKETMFAVERVAVKEGARNTLKAMSEGMSFKRAIAIHGTAIADYFDGEIINVNPIRRATAHSLDITDSMREAALAGQPMFKHEDFVSIKLTPAETEYFAMIFGSEADMTELHESVPSVSLDNNELSLNSAHLPGLTAWVDETVIRRQKGDKIPQRFVTDQFLKILDDQATADLPPHLRDQAFRKEDQTKELLRGDGSTVSKEDIDFIMDENRWLDIGLKIGKKTKVYRGSSTGDAFTPNTESGMSTQGRGLYTTTDKAQAKEYGEVFELDHYSLPKKPIRFRDELNFNNWLQIVRERFGFKRISEFEETNGGAIDVWVRKIDPDIDGIQIGTGKGAYFVKFPAEDPTDSGVMFRREDDVIARIDENAKGAAATIKKWTKRNFTKEGLGNKKSFELKIKMDAEKNFGESELSELVFDFQNDVTKAYGVKKYNDMSEADLNEVNQYLRGDKGVALPQGLHGKIDHMRAYLDRLSGGMLVAMKDMLVIERSKLSENERKAFELYQSGAEGGYLPKSMEKHWNLYQTISGNMGTYMTRSYQAFDDPAWKERAMKDTDLMNRAMEFVAENNPDLDQDELVGAVRAILQDAKKNGNFMSFISKGSKLGAKDVSIVTKRKDVPAVIRELLGEYTDPKVNFIRSASKMQWFLANHNFLMKLRENGLGTFLFEKPTGEFDDQIAGEGSETMNPVNGLYTTEDFRQSLDDAVNKFEGSDLMRNIIAVNSMVKYGKTILSPTTQARNFMSAAMFTVMNGHFDWREAGKAFRVAKSDLFTKDKKWREYVNHLIKIGVMHDNPFASELRDAIKDFTELDVYSNKPGQNLKKFLNFMQKSYQLGDDFWKIIGFENELASLKKEGLTGAEAEEKAAYRIRNGYPTYSMVPRGLKQVRRWPLIGTFVSFPYEIVRTSYNQLEFLKEDMKNNKPAAARRAMGMAIASGAAYSASIFSMMLMGMDADDDEAVRAQLPPWSRNSQLVYMGYDDNGMPVYLDLSYLDPYTYIKKPLTAILSGNNEGLDDKIEDALTEFLDPFIGVDIAAGALGEIIFNQKMGTGSQVYNPEDQGFDKATDIMHHIRKAVQPGIVSNMERTIKALGGEATRSGKQYDLGDEGLAWIGFRFGTLNLPQSMAYKGYEFKDRKTDATRILNNAAGSSQLLSDDDIESAVDRAYEARNNVYKDMMKQIKGSIKLGMPEREIKRLLRGSKVSSIDINYMVSGRVPPWKLPKSFMRSAMDRAKITAVSDERRDELKSVFSNRLRLIRDLINERNKISREEG